jgi:hypothetical protein
MASILITTADLIATAINAAEWDGVDDFKAVRSYATFEQTLEDQDVLHVDVVPVYNPTSELETRAEVVYVMAFDIAVRQRMGTEKQDQTTGEILTSTVDPLVSFVEAIHDYFCTDRFSGTNTTWKGTEFRAAYVREQLKDLRQFTGIVRLTFEGIKSL